MSNRPIIIMPFLNRSNVFCIFLYILIGTITTGTYFFTHYIDTIRGYRLSKNDGTKSVLTAVTSSLSCLMKCATSNWCLSVNYRKKSASCEILNFDPYDDEDDDDVKIDVDEDCLVVLFPRYQKLLFRAQRDVNKSVVSTWKNNNADLNPEPGCQFLTFDPTWCSSIYRNQGIDNWSQENFEEIKMFLNTANKTVKELVFSAQGTDYMSWLSQNNLIESSWNTLNKTNPATMQYFSLLGDQTNTNMRRFFICKSYGGCPNDELYMVVLDGYPVSACTYDTHSNYPKFLYAPGNNFSYFEMGPLSYHQADILAVIGRY